MRSRAWSVRASLFTMVIVVGAPLLALLIWTFTIELRREQGEARDTALRIARATAGRLRALRADSSDLLDRMTRRAALRNSGPADCDALFAVVEFFPQYANLFLFDRDGRLVCSGHAEARDEALSRRAEEWIGAEIRLGRFSTARPMVRLIEGRWVSVMSRETPAGILTLVELLDILEPEAVPASTVVTIIDGQGNVVARTADAERWVGRNVRHAEVTDLVLRHGEGRAEATGIDGTSRQYGYTRLPEAGWFIYAGVPTAEVMGPVRAVALRGIAAGALLVLAVSLFALRLARTIQSPVDRLSLAAAAVAADGFSDPVPVGGPREMQMLGQAFNEMVARRADAERRLVEGEQTLKALSDRLLAVQEEERTRIARELHDDLGQSLTALKMDVLGVLATAGPSAPDKLRQRIVQTLDTTMQAVQRISAELRPAVLDDFGLIPALELEARLFEERTAIECDLSLGSDEARLDADKATAIYRIVQEALTNVTRHADATRVEIRLRNRNGEILLEVRDNGRGISEGDIADGRSLGLIGIRERANTLGGSVDIEGIPGRGTIVSVRIPQGGSAGD